MSQLKSQYRARPRLIIGLGAAVVVFLFITLVPFSYTHVSGFEMTFNDVDSPKQLTAIELDQVVSSLGYPDVTASVSNDGQVTDYTFRNLPHRQAAREVAVAFAVMTDHPSEPAVKAVKETISGTIYAQVMDKITRIEVNTEGKTDEQIAAEIKDKLLAQGFLDANVVVSTDEQQGQTHISVDVTTSDDSGSESQQMLELQLEGSSDVAFDVPPQLEEIDTEGKTDAEIIAEIKARLAQRGITDPDVSITTAPDGSKQIEVQVEKEQQ